MGKVCLVTGSSGLVGSECVKHFAGRGWRVYGADNNQRAEFFGADGDTRPNLQRLMREVKGFVPSTFDIRDRIDVANLVGAVNPNLVIHCAAQPSHDYATRFPAVDWDVNAGGTLNLLEAVRQHAPGACFCFASTNKVYGDTPNRLPLTEYPIRFEFSPDTPCGPHGIGEWMSVDQCHHSVFGASKTAADLMVQEYARTFRLKTGVFRGGCLTGGAHAAAELHGFLAYLVRCCKDGRKYRVFGHQGKQVRDQLHAHDVARAFEEFASNPRPGEVYNLGGGKTNSVSVLEAIDIAQAMTGKKLEWEYVNDSRPGDHRVYYSDCSKLRSHYPGWQVTRSLSCIFEELCRQS